jgi:hypothetical protein
MRTKWLVLIVLVALEAFSQEPIRVPEKFDGFPVNYLQNLRVADSARRLDEKELQLLCRLFIKAYVVSIRQYNQDHPLETTAPVYKLLKENVPGLEARESESGRVVFLGAITRHLNTLPQFKPEVQQALREDLHRGKARCL